MVHLYGSTRQYLIGVRLPRRRTVSWVIPPINRLVKTIQSCVQTIEDLGQTFHRLVMLVDDFLQDESLKGRGPDAWKNGTLRSTWFVRCARGKTT